MVNTIDADVQNIEADAKNIIVDALNIHFALPRLALARNLREEGAQTWMANGVQV